jgi:hypothetical protein
MNKCDMCKGLGYLIVDYSCLKHSQMIQAKKHKCNVKEIEKCDTCNIFDTDQQANQVYTLSLISE